MCILYLQHGSTDFLHLWKKDWHTYFSWWKSLFHIISREWIYIGDLASHFQMKIFREKSGFLIMTSSYKLETFQREITCSNINVYPFPLRTKKKKQNKLKIFIPWFQGWQDLVFSPSSDHGSVGGTGIKNHQQQQPHQVDSFCLVMMQYLSNIHKHILIPQYQTQ